MIKVYTTDSCPWCDKVKTYLNVQDDMEAREEMIKKSRQMGVPVLDINDNIIIGFDKPAILKALDK